MWLSNRQSPACGRHCAQRRALLLRVARVDGHTVDWADRDLAVVVARGSVRSRPTGACLVLHGHGLRARTVIVRGQGRSIIVEIEARRYVCRGCDAVVLGVSADV